MKDRADPGLRLATGRIRVDAARAIVKLREYQLVDRTAWILEAIRAAVASGARAIALRGDANDVWLAWAGEPWPSAVLPTLFDELVSPEPARASQHLRLLGTAINTALGIAPSHVDVVAVSAGGVATRARYTPELLAPPSDPDEESPLRRMAVETIERPPEASAPGMLVHLRRRAGWGTLTYFLRGEPPELALARAACADLAVPIEIDGTTFSRAHHARDVMREPLGHGIDGFVALLDPAAPRAADRSATLEVAEHGVLLASYRIELAGHDDIVAPASPVPLRVFVDAPRIATNASRSEVRRDSHPVNAAEKHAHDVLPALLERVVARLSTEPADPQHAALRLAALALLGSHVYLLADATYPDVVVPLAKLPLLRDAIGRPRSLVATWRSDVAHLASEPLPEELAPWLGGVLWLPPDDHGARHIARSRFDDRATRKLIRRARRAARARTRFLGHRVREMKVVPRSRVLATIAIGAEVRGSAIAQAWLERVGIAGEVCIVDDERDAEVVLLHDGRVIETIALASPLAFQAVVDAPHLRPTDKYRGVMRDERYHDTIRAIRGSAIRAAERVASDAIDDGTARWLRRAIAAALDIDLTVDASSPLGAAAAWPTTASERLSLGDLRALAAPIGTTAPRARRRLPATRTIIAVDATDREALGRWLEGSCAVVHYDPEIATDADGDRARELARQLARSAGTVALAIRSPGVAAAIGVTGAPHAIQLCHAGVALGSVSYNPTLIDCRIAVDDDALVPDRSWHGVGDNKWAARSLVRWELELVRAIAGAIVGEPVVDLVRDTMVTWDSAAGRSLQVALSRIPSADVLGAQLLAALRSTRMLRVLGMAAPVSVDELAASFAGSIPVVPPSTAGHGSSEDWRPLVATVAEARAVAKLAGRDFHDAIPELEQRRRAVIRGERLARHRGMPEVAIALPASTAQAPLVSEIARGVIGLGHDRRLALHVHVERRLFAIEDVVGDLPLIAKVDVVADYADADFQALRADIRGRLVEDIRATAGAVVAAIAARDPTSLIDDAVARQLLRRVASRTIAPDLLTRLIETPMFPTLQGDRIALRAAGVPVKIARWDGEWLAPVDGEQPAPVDVGVVHVPAGELGDDVTAIITSLRRAPADVTLPVQALQTRRRIARGLIPLPVVHGVDPALKRRLDQLGAAAGALGAGEVALVDEVSSVVVPHRDGVGGLAIAIDVLPPVTIAIEAPELITASEKLRGDIARGARWSELQSLARLLVHKIVAAGADEIPVWARRRIRHALFAGRLTPDAIGAAPIFETTTGEWKPWSAVVAQRDRYTCAWYAAIDATGVPLDPDRIAFRLSNDEVVAAGSRFALIDASNELRLDELARVNQKRAKVRLALSPDEVAGGLHTGIELAGADSGGTRGWVIPLAPAHASLRATRAHADGFPFERVEDQCQWPTIAVIDNPALVPDRTWSKPARDATWSTVVEQIRVASLRALRAIGNPPPDAIGRWQIEPQQGQHDVLRVGRVWVVGPPGTSGTIKIACIDGELTVQPEVPVRGWIAVLANRADLVLDDLWIRAYKKILHDLSRKPGNDVASAHVAYGLARRIVVPRDVDDARFACFRPAPLAAAALHELFDGTREIDLIDPADRHPGPALVADGSETSRVIANRLGWRAMRGRGRGRDKLPGVADVAAAESVVEYARRVHSPTSPPHPLKTLATLVHARLLVAGIGVDDIGIVDRDAPIAHHVAGKIELAARNPHVLAIDAARAAGSPWAAAAIDALVAHVATVLNVALTEVTDANESAAIDRLLRR